MPSAERSATVTVIMNGRLNMLKTDRLTLRPFAIEDKNFLFELNNDKTVNRYRSSDRASMEYCMDSIKDWNEKYGNNLLNVYLMKITATKESIGLVGIFKRNEESKAEIGYRMMPQFWGCGYCKEATKELITKYFSQTNEEEIFAETHPENENSIRFLMNNKFIEVEHEMENRGKIYITSRKNWLD